MHRADFPIVEFDPDRDALITAHAPPPVGDVPRRAVLCFFHEVLESLRQAGQLVEVGALRSEIGRHPIWRLETRAGAVAILHPGVGAPLAAGLLEELLSLGPNVVVACGGAGVLNRDIARGHLVVPTAAVRDEGTSYHYLPPAREVEQHPRAVAAIRDVLDRHSAPYLLGKTWTTDALYRETRTRIARRRAEGCLTVEMEAAAFFAVGQFRDVIVGQLLYGGDDVVGDQWDMRDWGDGDASTREKLLWLGCEAALTVSVDR